jgi:hypothetical protein
LAKRRTSRVICHRSLGDELPPESFQLLPILIAFFSFISQFNPHHLSSPPHHISILPHRNSINSQKFSDERHGPFRPYNVFQGEMRSQPNFRPAAAISSYAGQEAGNAKSFRAMRYYQGGFAERRDEILTEIAKSG